MKEFECSECGADGTPEYANRVFSLGATVQCCDCGMHNILRTYHRYGNRWQEDAGGMLVWDEFYFCGVPSTADIERLSSSYMADAVPGNSDGLEGHYVYHHMRPSTE